MPSSIPDRLLTLERELAELRRRTVTAPERPAGVVPGRQVRIAKTVKDPTAGTYPTAPCDSYWIVFCDGSYTKDDGDQTPTWTDRQDVGYAKAVAHNLGGTALIAEGTHVLVALHNGQWWIDRPDALALKLGKANGPISAGGSGSVSIWAGNPEADTLVDVTAVNWGPGAIANGAKVYVMAHANGINYCWYADTAATADTVHYALAYALWEENGGDPRVLCLSCTDRAGANPGNPVDAFYVYLQRRVVGADADHYGKSRDPNVRTDDVITYRVDAAGDKVCDAPWAFDDAVGTVKWWTGTKNSGGFLVPGAIPRGWALMDGVQNAAGNGGTGIDARGKFLWNYSSTSHEMKSTGGTEEHNHDDHDHNDHPANTTGETTATNQGSGTLTTDANTGALSTGTQIVTVGNSSSATFTTDSGNLGDIVDVGVAKAVTGITIGAHTPDAASCADNVSPTSTGSDGGEVAIESTAETISGTTDEVTLSLYWPSPADGSHSHTISPSTCLTKADGTGTLYAFISQPPTADAGGTHTHPGAAIDDGSLANDGKHSHGITSIGSHHHHVTTTDHTHTIAVHSHTITLSGGVWTHTITEPGTPGSYGHVHTAAGSIATPGHTHSVDVAAHTHAEGSPGHSHTIVSHQHTLATHNHLQNAHYHSTPLLTHVDPFTLTSHHNHSTENHLPPYCVLALIERIP